MTLQTRRASINLQGTFESELLSQPMQCKPNAASSNLRARKAGGFGRQVSPQGGGRDKEPASIALVKFRGWRLS